MIKKIMCLAICGALSLSCIGCVSKSDYDALEQRVSALESKVGMPTDPTSYYDAFVPETSNVPTNQNSSDYSLEGMSAEEIYAECRRIFSIIPKTSGLTVEEYSKCLGYEGDFNFPNFYNKDLNLSSYYPNYDSIKCIEVTGLQKEMNNTVGYVSGNGDSGLWIWTKITLYISDYETAKAVYELMLADYLITSNSQEGTWWYAEAQNPQSSHIVAEMEMADNGYVLKLTDLVV